MSQSRKKMIILVAILISGMAITLLNGISGTGSLGLTPALVDPLPPPAPVHRPGISVFFTDPTLDTYRGGPETGLIAAIDSARIQVDLAAYDLNLWGLRDALIAAHRRGVVVRMVLEANNLESEELQALAEAGIPIVADRADGLMHNKFVVIDRWQVWTGSMNFTLNGAYRNDNHLIMLNSKEAAEVYRIEFEEMFSSGLFGAYSPAGVPVTVRPESQVGEEIAVRILFSPDDGVAEEIVFLIETAVESIHFMAFSFTSDDIGQAMLSRAQEGVKVRGVFDESQLKSNRGAEYDYLLAAGLDVRIDGNRNKLHHKVIILDGETVIAGSYNFSVSAETRNDENILVIQDVEIANVFLAEWERVFKAGR